MGGSIVPMDQVSPRIKCPQGPSVPVSPSKWYLYVTGIITRTFTPIPKTDTVTIVRKLNLLMKCGSNSFDQNYKQFSEVHLLLCKYIYLSY